MKKMANLRNKIIVTMLIFATGFTSGSILTTRRIESAVNIAITEKSFKETSNKLAKVCYYEYY